MLLNVSIFLWYGAYIPWYRFVQDATVHGGRLIFLGVAVLLLRRLPWIYAMHRWIPQITDRKQAIFMGFFGPIGVSAVYYIFVSLEFIEQHLSDENGQPRDDVRHLGSLIRTVVWFLCVCSIVVHGLSIPLGTLGFVGPRAFGASGSVSLGNEDV